MNIPNSSFPTQATDASRPAVSASMTVPAMAPPVAPAQAVGPAQKRASRLGILALAGAWLAVVGACAPLEDTVYFADQDFTPPSIISLEVTGPTSIVARFSEDTTAERAFASSELGELEVEAAGTELTFITERPGEIGRPYQLEAVVADAAGNTMSFVETIYGYNPAVPDVLINEFTTQGSGNHPDVVELRLLSAGNLAGLTLYAGAPAEYDGRLVFPDLELPADSFVVVHFKAEDIPEEVNELDDPTASGGLDATDTGWDFWVEGSPGISGNNGAVSLYDQPGGNLLDAVIYSNRTSDSDDRYRGFGSKKALAMVDGVAADGGWVAAGAQPAPEDAVDPEDSTATRSMNRASNPTDTDSAADWHIVPTSGYTFGAPNNDEVYVP